MDLAAQPVEDEAEALKRPVGIGVSEYRSVGEKERMGAWVYPGGGRSQRVFPRYADTPLPRYLLAWGMRLRLQDRIEE